MITAQVVLAFAIMQRPVTPERRRLILMHFTRTRRPDGGWGLHPESHSYLFVTILVYVASRLLGEPADSTLLQPATAWLSHHPEGLGSLPSWGRFWLALVGLYDRDRVTVCPPEVFLLPRRLSLTDRLYCHTRYIYLGMACLWGQGLVVRLGEIGDALRQELKAFSRPTASSAHHIASTDVYIPPGPGLLMAYRAMALLGPAWHRVPGSAALRRRAVRHCLHRIRSEQRATGFQALSPVSGLLNTLALWTYDPSAPEVEASIAGLETWCWQDTTDGLRYAGARSSSWDTAFALQALAEVPGAAVSHATALGAGHRSLTAMQIVMPPDDLTQDRQDPTGGWCFGGGEHGWPVSDCAAEALSALLQCQSLPGVIPPAERLPPQRLRQAVRFVLARQNHDGGFATYEARRGGAWLERLNPSEMFGQCMTERSYIECTSSAIRALRHVQDLPAGTLPSDETAACASAMQRGVAFLLSGQRSDGSWPGFWGINFIYATGLAVAALRDGGLASDHPAVLRAAAWLTAVQHPDGGWGEHFSGCLTGEYVSHQHSLVISTSWAVLGLLHATNAVSPAVAQGLDWLMANQSSDGDWPRDSCNGVFFGTAMLDYRLYNSYFPVWALAAACTYCDQPKHVVT